MYIFLWLVVDSNAVAQEKGLDAALAFVENAAVAGKTTAEVAAATIQKCLGAPKAKTKEKGQELLLMYIEIEKGETVVEELITGLTASKNPKVVAACVQTLRKAVGAFGTKAIQVKPVVKVIPTLLEDRDKTVRDETKLLVVELNRWLGPALKGMMSNVKPLQLQEIEAELEKAESEGKPVVSRWLRSQRAQAAAVASVGPSEAGGGEAVVAEAAPEAADPWDFLDPVDVLSKMPKDFGEKMESKKWQDRKEALDALLQLLTENPKLDPQGHYGELVAILKKAVAKDANINVVAVGAKCLAKVALGLRKKFGQFALVCIGAIVEKFKEKKSLVVDGLREAIDAIYKTVELSQFISIVSKIQTMPGRM